MIVKSRIPKIVVLCLVSCCVFIEQSTASISHGMDGDAQPVSGVSGMNTQDDCREMYVRYTPGSAANGNAPKVLRVYVAVPAAKIEQGRQGNPYSDEDIAIAMAEEVAIKHLAQLHSYWKICLASVPEELQHRAPNFAENGISLWTITG